MLYDLGVIMLTAGTTSLLCKFIKQPVVLGYIVAGLLVGPYVAGAAWVEAEDVEVWGQVGVTFLLFTLGLEFSFKKLVKMGQTAIIGCLTIVVGMMTTGFLLGQLLGWDQINSLFLGGMLCMSSTTIVFKALDDMGLRQQKFAGICFGILVVEDLFAVVLMVLLASIAVKNSFDGLEMANSILKLVGYLLAWFVLGISLIPSLLKVCKKHLNDETLTIVSLGLCLGMVMLAESAGFSSALGAFVMGSILAETLWAEKIEHLMSPIKNMFGAVFFVSVGMMIDPKLLVEYWFPITIITIAVILGQIIFASLGVVLSGQPLKTAMQSAFALTQVGEFAFIIAGFGSEKGITEPYLYPVIVAVSVITTFLTPYTIRLAEPAYKRLDILLPNKIKLWLEDYANNRNVATAESAWRRLLKKISLSLAIYSVSSIAILTIYATLVSDLIVNAIEHVSPADYQWLGRLTALVIALILILPLIYKILSKHYMCQEAREIWESKSIKRLGIVLITLTRLVIASFLIVTTIAMYFKATIGVLFVLAAMVMLIARYSKKIQQQSTRLEKNFHENLMARELEASNKEKAENKRVNAIISSTDVDSLHFHKVIVNADSHVDGQSLKELDLRNTCGVNVVSIQRGDQVINNPLATERLLAKDKVTICGSAEQIALFRMICD